MTPERWAEVRAEFARLSDFPPDGRAEELAALGWRDPALWTEVMALQDAEARAGGFLEGGLGFGDRPSPAEAEAEPEPLPESIGPYRIDGLLGRGGMGTVYRATHREVPRPVALKVVRSGLDGTELRRRFRSERELLAPLEHPSIARLYDSGATEDGRPYFAMELVDGETLVAYADNHALAVGQRIELFLQAADAVAFAHGRGIVHRDLKPSNLLVDAAGRLKLLDFGVAKLLDLEPPGGETRLTAAPFLTPEYASPEQIRGEPIGPASDVYSLGVVLYELLAGKRPYDFPSRAPGANERVIVESEPAPPSRAAARGASGAPPKAPRSGSGGGLRGDLDAIVLRALRKDPARRYGNAAELADDLRRHLAGRPVVARRGGLSYRAATALSRHRFRLAGAVLLALAVAGGFVLALLLAGAREVRPRSAAILGLVDLDPGSSGGGVGGIWSELLASELAAGGELRIVPQASVERAVRDVGVADPRRIGDEERERLRRRLGADLFLVGSYLLSSGENGASERLRVDLRVIDAASGETVAAVAEEGEPAAILELVARGGFDLRARLGFEALSLAEADALVAARPADARTARLLAAGAAARHAFRFAEARALLEEAARAAPDWAPARHELAELLDEQGYASRAVAEGERAVVLSGALPRSLGLLYVARQAQRMNDWRAAIAANRERLALEPENLEAGLDLAAAQISNRDTRGARATIARLRALREPFVEDPRIDLLEARVLRGQPGGRAAAERAVAKGKALAAHQLVARARFAEGAQHWDTPEIERAIPAFEEALRLWRLSGDRVGESQALRQIAFARFRAGDVARARAELEALVATLPAGDLPAARLDAVDFLASLEREQLALARARELHLEAAGLAELLGVPDSAAAHRGWAGSVLFFAGDLAGARRELESARARLEELAAEFFREDLSLALGWLELEAGDLEAARARAREVAATDGGAAHEPLWAAERLWLEAEILASEGETDAALERLDRARTTFEGSSQRQRAAEAALASAEIELSSSSPERAADLAREAADRHRRFLALTPTWPAASAVWARALLAAGRLEEARAAFAPVGEAAARSESVLHRWAVAIDEALLVAAAGELATARNRLIRVAGESAAAGYVATSRRAEAVLSSLENPR